MSFDAAGCSRLFNARIASRMTANGTPRRFAAVPNFGSDRSEADMPRASGACRSDENDPTRTWSEGRANTVALATEQCAPVLMKGRRRLRRLIYDDVKLVRDTIQRLGAGTAPPGAVHRPRLALRQPVRGRAHVDQHLSGRWHRCRHLPQRHDFRTADVQKLYGLHEISSHLHVARQDYRAGNGSANTSTARAESVRAERRPARSPRCKASADRPATHAPL
jgi:hypothetical protein